MRNHRNSIRAQLALSIVIAVTAALFALVPASAAQAQTAQGRDYYGAIALSSDGTATYAFDYSTKRGALNAAFNRCRSRSNVPSDCVKVGWVRNACGAVAVQERSNGTISRYNFGFSSSRARAEANARRNFGGRIAAWVCTTR